MRRTIFALPFLLALAACDDGRGLSELDLSVPQTVDGGSDLSGPATHCELAGEPKLLSNLPGDHGQPKVGYTGSGFLVAWNTTQPLGALQGNRIDATVTDLTGNRLGPNLSLSDQPIADIGPPSVAALTGGTVVAWTRVTPASPGNATDIMLSALDGSGQRLDGNGVPCDPADQNCGEFQVTTSGSASDPELARPEVDGRTAHPTDDQVSLAFIDSRNYPCSVQPCVVSNDVYWKKLQGNGTVLIADKQITQPGLAQVNARPRIAFDGVHDGLVWRTTTGPNMVNFSFATLDAMGLVNSPPVTLGTAEGAVVTTGAGDLVWAHLDYGLVTATGSDSAANVLFQRFLSNGTKALGPVGITFGGVSCTPSVAWDGQNYAVVWQTDCGQPGSNIGFELIDAQGFRLQPNGTSCEGSVDSYLWGRPPHPQLERHQHHSIDRLGRRPLIRHHLGQLGCIQRQRPEPDLLRTRRLPHPLSPL